MVYPDSTLFSEEPKCFTSRCLRNRNPCDTSRLPAGTLEALSTIAALVTVSLLCDVSPSVAETVGVSRGGKLCGTAQKKVLLSISKPIINQKAPKKDKRMVLR